MKKSRRYIADIHVHNSMRPFHSSMYKEDKVSIWDNVDSNTKGLDLPKRYEALKDVSISYSQADFTKCQAGNSRLQFLSITPPEMGMFDMRQIVDKLIRRDVMVNLGARVAGFDKGVIKERYDRINNNKAVFYFDETCREYEFIIEEQGRDHSGETLKRSFKVVSTYDEAMSVIDQDDHTIAVIITIEGGHALCNHLTFKDMRTSPARMNNPQDEAYRYYLAVFKQNINRVKEWGAKEGQNHSPLFLTFAHHFWNLLCGQAKSIEGVQTVVLNQNLGKDLGFSQLGREILTCLLSRDNGRRVLIDTKHMSVASRQEFYSIWEEYERRGDGFPIINSHAAVNGISLLSDPIHLKDTRAKNKDKYFNTWSINMCDEDIIYTHRSGGLIGLMLHETRMPGQIPKRLFQTLRVKIKDNSTSEVDRDRYLKAMRREYTRLLMANAFHIVRTIGSVEGWDCISFGTDFDGLINPFDTYDEAEKLPVLIDDFLSYLQDPSPIYEVGFSRNDLRDLQYGLSPQEIVDKIAFGNVERFLKRYYNNDYLLKQPTSIAVGELV